MARRILRIFPVYYITILILWLLSQTVVRDNLVYLLTFTFNYALKFKNLPKSSVNHFWSLCVEEQFYFLWPFFVFLLKRNTAVLFIVTIIIVVVGYAQQVFFIFPSLARYNYISLLTRMAPLALGALGAIAASKNRLPAAIFTNKLFGYGMLLLLAITLATSFKFKVPVLGLCSLYLVITAAFYEYPLQSINRLLQNRTVLYIGTISYGIYVFHYPILYYCNYIFDPLWAKIDFSFLGRFQKYTWHTWIIKFPLYSLLSIGLAALSYKFIETPILKLKDRFFKYNNSRRVFKVESSTLNVQG